MRRSILLAISLLLQYLCVNYSLAQKLFFESTLYNDSIVIDDWVNNKYGLHVQKYEPQRLQAKNSAVDNTIGWQHLSYELTYKNIPLEFCQIKVHKKDGVIVSINGACFNEVNVNIIPTISENNARSTAISYINADVYSWQLSSSAYFDLIEAPQLKELPQGKLVICPQTMNGIGDSLVLAYKFSIYAITPESYTDIYVDAHTNDVLFTLSKISSITGIAETWYSGIQNIETSYKNNQYYLHDSTRCDGKVCVYTYDISGTSYYQSPLVQEITDNDNYWTTTEFRQGRKDMAFDAHWGAGITLDYFYNTFGRIGYDDTKPIRNYVCDPGNATNASWDGYVLRFGDGSNSYNPLVSLDIVAHEIGHAITTSEADLIYRNESGAINEGISDIWAACVTNYVDMNKDIWQMGEECSLDNSAFRYMASPKQGEQPDTYEGAYWLDYKYQPNYDNGGVHINSGIMNYWFFLLTMGGEGNNDNDYDYNINGIGFEKSEQIVYKALVDYFTETTDYAMAAILTREAAAELFGICSEEVRTVIDAWKAVGITIDLEIPQSLYITETISTDKILTYRAIDSIIATNIILEGANVTYLTTNEIHLQNGFHAKNGTTFRALIEPCSIKDQGVSQSAGNRLRIATKTSQNETSQLESAMYLYPNPCHTKLVICDIPSDILSYQIFDIHGKLMKVGYISQTEVTIKTGDLPSGIYVLSLDSKDEGTHLKFIKQ